MRIYLQCYYNYIASYYERVRETNASKFYLNTNYTQIEYCRIQIGFIKTIDVFIYSIFTITLQTGDYSSTNVNEGSVIAANHNGYCTKILLNLSDNASFNDDVVRDETQY